MATPEPTSTAASSSAIPTLAPVLGSVPPLSPGSAGSAGSFGSAGSVGSVGSVVSVVSVGSVGAVGSVGSGGSVRSAASSTGPTNEETRTCSSPSGVVAVTRTPIQRSTKSSVITNEDSTAPSISEAPLPLPSPLNSHWYAKLVPAGQPSVAATRESPTTGALALAPSTAIEPVVTSSEFDVNSQKSALRSI